MTEAIPMYSNGDGNGTQYNGASEGVNGRQGNDSYNTTTNRQN